MSHKLKSIAFVNGVVLETYLPVSLLFYFKTGVELDLSCREEAHR